MVTAARAIYATENLLLGTAASDKRTIAPTAIARSGTALVEPIERRKRSWKTKARRPLRDQRDRAGPNIVWSPADNRTNNGRWPISISACGHPLAANVLPEQCVVYRPVASPATDVILRRGTWPLSTDRLHESVHVPEAGLVVDSYLSAEACRTKALDCMIQADSLEDPKLKAAMLQYAEWWNRLAEYRRPVVVAAKGHSRGYGAS